MQGRFLKKRSPKKGQTKVKKRSENGQADFLFGGFAIGESNRDNGIPQKSGNPNNLANQKRKHEKTCVEGALEGQQVAMAPLGRTHKSQVVKSLV